jgi:hypothetical protein
MSTLTVTNIKATGETNSRAVSGVAAGYLNFAANVATPSVTDSFNHSSITDGGTGIFACNFVNNMANANFGHCDGGDHSAAGINTNKFDSRSSSTFNCRAYDFNGTLNDNAYISLSFIGDLA